MASLPSAVPSEAPGGALPRARTSPKVEVPAPHGDPVLDRRRHTLVLLVDDLEDQREMYREYLEFAGYVVVVARDGFEGIDRALRERPDVVVMDLAMPGLDGFEATERLKVLERTRRIPVIALTAHGELPREWALRAGCAAYLRKPCFPDELAMAIEDVLEGGSLALPRPVAPRPALARPRVLIADGSVADRELFAEYLEYRGCRVSVSLEPDAVLADARQRQPAVIILDLDTPRLQGWSLLDRLRADEGTRSIPVIGLSRRAVGSARARSRGAALLIKPCEPEALYREVSRSVTGGDRERH
jgi:two-component system cell cycle response regulator DivK